MNSYILKLPCQVLVNGFLTIAFDVTRSMRQGCGLSPLLFNIAVEPLICNIKQSLLFKIKPSPGYPQEERVICKADDITALVRDEFLVHEILALSDFYSKTLGAEINIKNYGSCG